MDRYESVTHLLAAIESACRHSLREVPFPSASLARPPRELDDAVSHLVRAAGGVRNRLILVAARLVAVSALVGAARWLRSTTDLPAPAGALGPRPTPSAAALPVGDDEEAVRQVLEAYAWVLRTGDLATFER